MINIAALGAASQDVFISGKGIRAQLDPRTNEHAEEFSEEFKLGAKITVDNIHFATGGGATNAAVTFARQGLQSSFIGKIGRDLAAEGVLKELSGESVDTSRIIYSEELGTQYSTILLADNGERTILIYRGSANTHVPADYEPIDFNGLDWIYVSSFAGALDALEVIFRRATEAGAKIAFNPGEAELGQADRLKALLANVSLLLVNKEEAQKLVAGTTLEELARNLHGLVPTAVVSDGPNGVTATDGTVVVEAGLYEDVPVLDRTGAGDAFGSGFLSQWAQGKPLKDAVVFASANSTSVVTQIGAKAGILRQGTELHEMPLTEKPF